MENISSFFDLFGGPHRFINIFLIVLLLLAVVANTKRKTIRLGISFLSSLLVCLQLSSLLITGNYIGYSFLIHFNARDFLPLAHLFEVEIFLFFVLFFLFFFLFQYSVRFKKRLRLFLIKTPLKNYYSNTFIRISINVLFVFSSLFIMSLNRGIISDTYKLVVTLRTNNDSSFNENLLELGINDYTPPNKTVTERGKKNIIILSLESYEKSYLTSPLNHLTPFLSSLKTNSEWSYFDMNQNKGSEWTSGSLYTTLTGFPAFFGGHHNSIFQSSVSSSINGVPNILKTAGYELIYLVDNAKFGGTEDMLYTLGFDKIIDQYSLGKELQDKDLFEKAKKIIQKKSDDGKPYVLYISTLSTHYPTGIYDQRMEGIVPPQENDLKFMVSAVDYMIKDIITYLNKTGQLSNTVIYIFPDHLKMGNPAIFKNSDRGLFVLTNANKDKISYEKDSSLLQIDLPNIILQGSEINHNGKFLTDYIQGNKNTFIENNITTLTKLNVSGFKRFDTKRPVLIPKKSDNYANYKSDTTRFIAHAGGAIEEDIYTNSLEALDLSYKKGFRLFELDIRKTSDNKFVAVHDWNQWASFTKYNANFPITENEFLARKILGKYTPMNMELINEWFKKHPDAILITDKVNTPKEFADQFIDKTRLMMELFSWDAILEAIENNIEPMASESVINSLKGDKVNTLKKHAIKNVAMSRLSLSRNLELFKALKEGNINVYAYSVNDNIDKDEEYVVKYEMDYFYGIYADNWSFIKK